MTKKKRNGWFGSFVVNILSGLFLLALTWGVGYWFGKISLSGEVAEGLTLLDLDTTSDSLATLVSSFDNALSLLAQRKPHPAKSNVAQLNDSLDKLSKALEGVKTTEFYSVEELKKLADSGGSTTGSAGAPKGLGKT